MSVINKMLQDLDQRRGRPGGEAASGDAIRSVVPASTGRQRQAVLLATVGLIVGGLIAGWWWQRRNEAIQVATVAPPVAVVAVVAPPIQPAVVPPAPVVVGAPAVVDRSNAPREAVTTMVADTPATRAVAPVPAAQATPTTSTSAVVDKLDSSAKAKPVAAAPRSAEGKSYTPEQLSTNLLADAIRLEQQGQREEAKIPLQKLLAINPLHVRARQLLAQLLLDTDRPDQARTLLAEGRRLLPEQSNFTLTLARLQVDSGDVGGAIRLLEADPAAARNDPQMNAFLGALLLRVDRHDEAVQRYLVALRSDPGNPSWLVGAGVALEGAGKPVDAAEAYQRAAGSPNLPPETADFLTERLTRLRR